MATLRQFTERVLHNVERVIVGKRDAIELALVALLCGGHILIEDVPGVGKTMLVRALALFRSAQALAAVRRRDRVLPEDVKTLAPTTLAHRVILKPDSQLRGRTGETVISALLDSVEVPVTAPARA